MPSWPGWRSRWATSTNRWPSCTASGDVDRRLFERALRIALDAAAERPAALRRLDRRREIDPGWFQRTRMQGYVCYVDRFCGTLAELPDRLDYLAELGTTYLHLMPLLRPRPGENDGGYAVDGLPRRRPAAGHDGPTSRTSPAPCTTAA